MKTYHFTLFFLALAISLMVVQDISSNESSCFYEYIKCIDRSIDNGSSLAASFLLDMDQTFNSVEADKLVDIFVSSIELLNPELPINESIKCVIVSTPKELWVKGSSEQTDWKRVDYRSVTLNMVFESELQGYIGEFYKVRMPDSDEGLYAGSVKDYSVMFFIEQCPIRGLEKSYSRYSYAHTGVTDGEVYYITKDNRYHREKCVVIDRAADLCDLEMRSTYECAKYGAYPCEICLLN